MDTFETVKADLSESKALQSFDINLRREFSKSLTYFVASEYYSLITRFSVLALKIFFIFLRLVASQKYDLKQDVMRINVMNTSLLELRNNLFMLLEYWSEAHFEQSRQAKKEYEFSLARSIDATHLKINDRKVNTVKCLKRVDNKGASIDQILRNEIKETGAFSQRPVLSSVKSSGALVKNRLNFNITAKSKTLIMGTSNMDKNMVLKILTCQESYLGSLQVDGIEISKIQDTTIYKKTAYLSEAQFVFNNSIAYNILYGTGITLQFAIQRLKILGLFDYFREFRRGFDTVVGNKVYGLSNGQIQMICFCRCILKECDLYLLEEPSIFLDCDSERMVYEAISRLEDKTVIVSTKFSNNSKYFSQILKIK